MNKKDFAIVFTVKNANPNGDPNNGNRPRTTYSGLGEITDVSLKRKIRNRLLDNGLSIFVQSDSKTVDEFTSLKDRMANVEELKKAVTKEDYSKIACSKFFDIRAFGQVISFKGEDADGKKTKGLSIGIRGPVSIQNAYSVSPVSITTNKITKSVNLETKEDGGLSADRMGDKHSVDFGLYVAYGSINAYLAEDTNFTEEDCNEIKKVLPSIFENDSSTARPEGSMEVVNVYWWEHENKSGQYSSAKVHRSLKVKELSASPQSIEDYNITVEPLQNLKVEVLEGF
ncbi:type I-C CRISPR-associated protein Cas7/Csd2 [Solibacillus isronensis]|uniref:type I-C CRISPR-associated protein Cas7/Csd2 n=1 Tax=Solibacillus isronensis TaxID=412383 RepID=UPI0009A61D7C|nr:type I-C CRISPR-associated protein Cas7/Csd2 [Solibacillus isronensis]